MKKITICLIIVIMLVGCTDKKNTETSNSIIKNKVDYNISSQKVLVPKNRVEVLDKNNLNSLDKYEITTTVDDNFGKKEHKYIGIKLADILPIIEPEEYVNVVFGESILALNLLTREDAMHDQTYLIFNIDGKDLNKGLIIARFNQKTYLWVYDVKQITFQVVSI